MSATFAPREKRILASLQEAFFPDGASLLSGGRDHLGDTLDRFFADAKPVLVFGVRLLLGALELSPLLHRGSRFSRLPLEERVTWIAQLMASPRPGVRALGMIPKLLAQGVAYDDPAFLKAEGLPDPR